MATFVHDEVTRREIRNKKIVTTKKDAIRFNGRTFAIGDVIGFQYGNTTVVGKLEGIDKDLNIIYVSVKANSKLEGIYGFYVSQIQSVYGTFWLSKK